MPAEAAETTETTSQLTTAAGEEVLALLDQVDDGDPFESQADEPAGDAPADDESGTQAAKPAEGDSATDAPAEKKAADAPEAEPWEPSDDDLSKFKTWLSKQGWEGHEAAKKFYGYTREKKKLQEREARLHGNVDTVERMNDNLKQREERVAPIEAIIDRARAGQFDEAVKALAQMAGQDPNRAFEVWSQDAIAASDPESATLRRLSQMEKAMKERLDSFERSQQEAATAAQRHAVQSYEQRLLNDATSGLHETAHLSKIRPERAQAMVRGAVADVMAYAARGGYPNGMPSAQAILKVLDEDLADLTGSLSTGTGARQSSDSVTGRTDSKAAASTTISNRDQQAATRGVTRDMDEKQRTTFAGQAVLETLETHEDSLW